MRNNFIFRIPLLFLASVFILSGSAMADGAGKKDEKPLVKEDEYIVSVDSGKGRFALEQIFGKEKALGARRFKTLSEFTGRNYYVVQIKEEEKKLTGLGRKSNGVTISPVIYRYLENTRPNDKEFKQQWCHSNPDNPGVDMASDCAWDITTGSEDVVVAVLDSGVDYTHPDLAANMWVNEKEIPQNNIDDDGNGYTDDIHGIDTGNNDSDPMDYDDHGTHCAGIIGALGNNGIGVAGVNWQVRIMAIKGFEEIQDSMSTTSELEAINYLLYMKIYEKINIVAVNASFGFYGKPDLQEQGAIEALGQAGILWVAAAGNSGKNNDITSGGGHYPSSYPLDNIISVAATDLDGNLAYFSNYGRRSVDLAAPGVDILSTVLHTSSYLPDLGNSIFYDDLESGGDNFTMEGTWAVTREKSSSPFHALSDSPGAKYQKVTDFAVTSRAIDLTGIETSLALGFQAFHDIEPEGSSYFDSLEIWYLSPAAPGSPAGPPIVPEKWGITSDKAASGTSSWTDSPNGEYGNNSEQWLLSAAVDLSQAPQGCRFKFKLCGDMEKKYDSLTVHFSKDNGTTWSEEMITIDGDHTAQWEAFSIPVPGEYLGSQFMAAFILKSDKTITKDGYYIDDIEIAHEGSFFFDDDVENGVGQWREPGIAAILPILPQWEKTGEFAGTSKGNWSLYSYEIPKKYFWNGFKFKFVLSADGSIQKDGVYIDNIAIGVPDSKYTYDFLSGTSMATPQVTGTAALVASAFPDLKGGDIKRKILDGVVAAKNLTSKVVTGGNLNLFGAVADLSIDSDDDSIPDYRDNCSLTYNPDQRDTDQDGFGNRCDCDLNNDDVVDQTDFLKFRQAWGSDGPDADFDGNNQVDQADFMIIRQKWGTFAPFE
jgi:subtilisin family serine protease